MSIGNVEIERKFLVPRLDTVWPSYHIPDAASGTQIVQGYLIASENRSLRVRLTPDSAMLTLKGPREGPVRIELEDSLSQEMAEQLLALCNHPLVHKIRYPLVSGEHIWAIDVFQERNEGLVVAEVELGSPDETLVVPEWCGPEITDEPRYYNQALAEFPFDEWGDAPF